MFRLLLAFSALSADATTPAVPSPDGRGAYRAAAARAGRDADAQVRLALWCEARGLSAERLKHLALAVMADPNHATARGLLGLVRDGDTISVDTDARTIDLDVPDEVVAERRAHLPPPGAPTGCGWLSVYARSVRPLTDGATLGLGPRSP